MDTALNTNSFQTALPPKLTLSHLKIGPSPKGNWYFNHPFSGATSVSGRVTIKMKLLDLQQKLREQHLTARRIRNLGLQKNTMGTFDDMPFLQMSLSSKMSAQLEKDFWIFRVYHCVFNFGQHLPRLFQSTTPRHRRIGCRIRIYSRSRHP